MSDNQSFINELMATGVSWQTASLIGEIDQGSANVLDFGAVGDGITDDTAAFRMAASSLTNGGQLLIPAGNFKLTNYIVLLSGTAVAGAGEASQLSGSTPFGIPYFTNPNYVTYNQATAPQTSPAVQTDHDYIIENLSATGAKLYEFVFAAHIRVRSCFCYYTMSGTRPACGQFIGCDDAQAHNNTIIGAYVALDSWKGCTRIKFMDNVLSIGTAAGQYVIGANASGNGNIAETYDDLEISGNSIWVNGTGSQGIQFDTLHGGCLGKNYLITNNKIDIVAGTVGAIGIIGRGDIEGVTISGNQIRNCTPTGTGVIHLGGSNSHGGVVTGTDLLTTTNGSNQVVCAYPNSDNIAGGMQGGWLWLNNGSGGATTAVGGLTFNGYYLILSGTATTVTIQASGNANASATGGGACWMLGTLGPPRSVVVTGNNMVGCSASGSALVWSSGPGHVVANNDLNGNNPAGYLALTYTDSADPTTSTLLASVVANNSGTASTTAGITSPAASNATRDAYTGLPLVLEPQPELGTPAWWMKGPLTFVDAVTFSSTISNVKLVAQNASGPTDLSKHLDLYSGIMGISITSNSVNYLVTSGGAHKFYCASSLAGYINAAGMNACVIGAQSPAAGSFTTVTLANAAGPILTGGNGAPSATIKQGSIYLRTDGGVGTTLYVTQGGGVWNAVAGV